MTVARGVESCFLFVCEELHIPECKWIEMYEQHGRVEHVMSELRRVKCLLAWLNSSTLEYMI